MRADKLILVCCVLTFFVVLGRTASQLRESAKVAIRGDDEVFTGDNVEQTEVADEPKNEQAETGGASKAVMDGGVKEEKEVETEREQDETQNNAETTKVGNPYDVIVLVLSARGNIDRRRAIRKVMVIGEPNEMIPERLLVKFVVGEGEVSLENDHSDILVMPEKDTYASLPAKLKYGYWWISKNFPSTHCVVKADDDMVFWPTRLLDYCKAFPMNELAVAGAIFTAGGVHRSGKWAEHHYMPSQYPPFPLGSYGHMVSNAVVHFVANNKPLLFEFQGEDTSLGIWLSGTTAVWKNDQTHFRNDQRCNSNTMIVGHDLSREVQMRSCKARSNTMFG